MAITGDAHRGYARRNMTQETRQVEILTPVVKEVIRVEQIERIPELMRRAFVTATSGRSGPVVVDVPEDVSHAEAEFTEDDLAADPDGALSPRLRCRPDARDIERAAALLVRAQRPMILVGGGALLSGASAALQGLAEAWRIPVAHTLSGKGAMACTLPLSAGLFGRYDRIANAMMEEADCILVVGCKLGEIATKRYTLPPAGGPADPPGHHPRRDRPLGAQRTWRCGATRAAAWRISPAAMGKSAGDGAFGRGVAARMRLWSEEAQPRYASAEQPINIGRIMGSLNTVMPADGIVVADGGFASHWSGLLYDTKQAGRGFVAGRGMASIGYGLPGALGAKLAAPDRPVVGLTGDGGFNMVAGDLETARRAGAGFVLIVLNNAASGYVKALQHAVYGQGAYQSSDLLEIDYADVARAYGCNGVRVEDPGALEDALQAGPPALRHAHRAGHRRHPGPGADAARRRQPNPYRQARRPAGLDV